MLQRVLCGFLLTLLAACSFATAAPFPVANEGTTESGTEYSGKSDLTVQQLEKLKSEEAAANSETSQKAPKQHGSVHIERHHYGATVKQNGELVSRVTQKGSADSVDGQPPRVHSETELEIPKQGIHKVLMNDGSHVVVHEPSQNQDAVTEKVFRGAARLVQPSSVAADSPPASAPPALSATNNGHRRFFNADITRESNNNMDHYTPYQGVQYSPLDMAEYVFWTGDERGVTTVVEDFLQEGLMTKDEAIAFLQEVKFNIEYLKAHYARQNVEDSMQQERAKNVLTEQASDKDIYTQMQQHARLRSFPFGNSADIIKTIASKNYELSNNAMPAFPVLPVSSASAVKRTLNDPMLSTNIINTSDYDRESTSPVSDDEYENMMDKLRAADSLYTQYTLEEIIYQLAKMMFTQTLSHEPAQSRRALQRFMSFLELEAERGRLSRNLEKKVLDVMISALSDTVADHPELVQSRDNYGLSPTNRFAHPMFDMSVSEPPMSRALLAAYKEEMARAQLKSKGLPGGN